jgi:hypothetical protein
MDPLTSVKTLCSLSVTILKWIDETIEKEEALKTLAATVKRIHDILERFQDLQNIEPTIINAFMGLGDMLSRTREHLLVWTSKQKKLSLNKAIGFLVPSQVTKRLLQDEQQLANQLVLILFAISSVTFVANSKQPGRSSNLIQPPLDYPLSKSQTNGVQSFWRDYVGGKVCLSLHIEAGQFKNFLQGSFCHNRPIL